MSKKDDVVTNKKLGEAVDVILTGVEGMVNDIRSELKADIGGVESSLKNEIAKNRKEIRENRRQIGGLKHDTPTRKEFDELKGEVNRYHSVVWCFRVSALLVLEHMELNSLLICDC